MDKYDITIATYNKCAVAFQDKFMAMDLYHDSYDRLCERIETLNPRILEIGCGPGNITRYLLSKRPDFDILATDLAEKMIELASVNAPQAKFRVMDCRDINTIHSTFDALYAAFACPTFRMKSVPN